MFEQHNLTIDLLKYQPLLQTKREAGLTHIFDSIRKKWLLLQPEEFVRQLWIHYLIKEKGYEKNRIAVEKEFMIYGEPQRFDLLAYDEAVEPYLLIECKAPAIKITEKTFDQIQSYNHILKVTYLIVTNGRHTFSYQMGENNKNGCFIDYIPDYLSE